MTVLVIHKKDAHLYQNVVLIDRTTKWGNPFKLIDYNDDRDLVLNDFRKYFLTNHELQCSVKNELSGKVLACWCKPKLCHGDVYAEFLNILNIFN